MSVRTLIYENVILIIATTPKHIIQTKFPTQLPKPQFLRYYVSHEHYVYHPTANKGNWCELAKPSLLVQEY